MQGEIHVGDVGTEFQVQLVQEDGVTPYSVQGASSIQFFFRKTDGTVITRPAAPLTTGLDGYVLYVTQAGDLDQPGTWKYQVYVQIGPNTKYSDVGKFRVYPNLST